MTVAHGKRITCTSIHTRGGMTDPRPGHTYHMELAVTELLGRLMLAAGLGAVVGVERDSAARGAGARTHALGQRSEIRALRVSSGEAG